MTDQLTNIGGVNISGISGGDIHTGDITSTITAEGDVVGRDKIVTNITNIVQQALSAVEEAAKAQASARQKLAEGVGAYAERLRAIALDTSDASAGGPYKGLLAYRLCDAELFFGRDRAIAELLAHLERGPLTVLHAESGAGKSSLLQAGIANRLIGLGHLPVYLRAYNLSPTLTIKRAFLPNLSQQTSEVSKTSEVYDELAEAPLRQFLGQVMEVLGQAATLYLILDQFEEFFTLLDEATRSNFVADLANCLEDESLKVRWVFSLRSEFFGNLANFRPRIPDPFENDYRLNRLTRREAEAVIITPAAQQNINFEPQLVETLLDDLRDTDSGEVSPPQIQLVCSALYGILQEQQSQMPGLPPLFTQQMYETAGRAQGILGGYLNRVLRRLVTPAEREAAHQLLIALVSSDQRRIRRTKSDLSATLTTYLTSAASLDGLLGQLVESRLLNTEEDEQTHEPAYELAHDYLLAQIRLDPETQARKAAEELLKQEVIAYKRFQTLLSEDKFQIINSQRAFLRLDDPDAKELLQKSEASRRRAQLQKYGAIAAGLLLIVAAAVAIALIQTRSARQQGISAATAQAGATQASRAEATAQAEAIRAQQAEENAQVEATRALQAKGTAQAEAARATQAEAQAERQAHIAQARELAVQAQTALDEGRPQRSLLLAMEALTATTNYTNISSAAAEQILRRAMATISGVPLSGYKGELPSMASSPTGRWLMVGSADGTVWLWDLAQGISDTIPPVVLHGHADRVEAVAFSFNDRWLVTGSVDGRVRLWDLTAVDLLAGSLELVPHQGPIRAIGFSSNNRWLAVGSEDATLRLWDLTAAPRPHPLELSGHTQAVKTLAFSPDNHWLVSGSKDETAQVWDLTANDIAAKPVVLSNHSGGVREIDISPDSRWLVTSNEGSAWLWQLNTLASNLGRERLLPGSNQISNTEQGIRAITFSSDNRWAAVGTGNGYVSLWNTINLSRRWNLPGHSAGVWAVTFSPDGHWLVTGSDDNTVRFWWDLSAPTPASRLLANHDEAIQNLAIISSTMASPGSSTQWLISRSRDNTIRLEPLAELDSVAEPLTLYGHTQPIWSLAFSSDSHWLATGSEDKKGRLWDLTANNPANHSLVLTGHRYAIRTVAISPDNHWLVTASDDHNAQLWDLTQDNPALQPRLLAGHTETIQTAAFSSNSEWLATGSWDGTVRLWTLNPAEPAPKPLIFTGHSGKITSLALSRDNRWLATGSADGIACLWNLEAADPTAEPIRLTGHLGEIRAVALSQDNHWLATGSADKTAWLWDLKAIQPDVNPIKLRGHTNSILTLAFSSNNRWLVTGSQDKTARLWDLTAVDPATEPMELRGHRGEIRAVAFSPDNRWLATGSDDKTVRLWDLTAEAITAEPIVLSDHQAGIRTIGFSPDNHWLVTADDNGVAKRWNLRQDELLELACRLVGRNLTLDEWKQYVRTEDYRRTCPNLPPHHTALNALLEAGKDSAARGLITDAEDKFQKALDLDPSLDFDPKAKAEQSLQETVQNLLDQGKALARAGNLEQAAAKFRAAKLLDPSLDLDPEVEARRLAQPTLENILDEAVGQADKGESEAAKVEFEAALKLAAGLNTAEAWHKLCVAGTRHGFAGTVLAACDQAIALEPGNGLYYNSRGIARLILGQQKEAQEDFEFFERWSR